MLRPIRRRYAGYTYSQDARQFLARQTATPPQYYARAIDAYARALRRASVWERFIALYPIGSAPSDPAGRQNLISSSFTCVDTAATPTFVAYQGITGNGSNAGWDTQINLSTIGGLFTQNDAGILAWGTKTGTDVGATCGVSNSYIFPRYTDGKDYFRINQGSDDSAASSDGSGLFGVFRTGASAGRIDRNGAQRRTLSTASAAPTNATFRILHAQGGDFYSGKVVLVGVGGSLTLAQSAALYQASLTLFNKLGTTL